MRGGAPGLPEPHEVFLAWLASQPDGADLDAAALVELERLSRYRGSHPGPLRLGAMFRLFLSRAEPTTALQ
jgi:hypothetical protein